MKGLHGGIPLAVLAAAARAQDVIGGPKGADVGGHASIPTKNTFSSSVDDDYKDDHSVDIKHDFDIDNHHHWPHPWKRGHPETSVIDGPEGDDVGNSASVPTVNTFSSEVEDEYTDNHSVDAKNDVDIDHKHGRPHPKRGHPETSVIDGPEGADVGNSAAIPTVNSFSSDVDEDYKDDHHWDQKNELDVERPWGFPWKRGHPDTSVIGGPSGDDVGNAATNPTSNSFSSNVDEDYKDDHHWDLQNEVDVDNHPPEWPRPFFGPVHAAGGRHHAMHDARAFRPDQGDTSVIDGPEGLDSGNSFSAPTDNSVDSKTEETYNDDHHVKADSSADIDSHPYPGLPHFEGHGAKYPSQPHVHGQAEASAPDGTACPNVHEVVHTVTRTHTAVQTATAYPQSHPEAQDPSKQYGAGTPFISHGHQQAPAQPHFPSGQTTHYPQPFSQGGQANQMPNVLHGDMASQVAAAAAATPLWQGFPDAPKPTQAAPYHGPVASGLFAAPASSFAVIPVQVPSGTPRVHGSVVVSPSSTPGASSAYHGPIPTGASPLDHAGASPSPSPSSHGTVAFTGGAGHIAPSAGMFTTVLAGVFAVLAFAL
ncbi:hypothetical protein BDW62DRAFT_52181 [Aspergillus aurantiobrunneus]